MAPRNYKLGTFHGKVVPNPKSKEALLRNALYLVGNLKVSIPNDGVKEIRIIGYEIPLLNEKPRTNCIDLLGYDQDHHPYIIELKKDDSSEKIEDIIDQVTEYEKQFALISREVEKQFRAIFHWSDFKFSYPAYKLIVAPKEFYTKKSIPSTSGIPNLYICAISNVKKVYDAGKLTIQDKLSQIDKIELEELEEFLKK